MKPLPIFLFLILLAGSGWSQTSLPRNLTEEERTRLYEVWTNRTVTPPPDSIVSAPAEFDSVAGILFAWEGYSTLLKDLIRKTAESDSAWVIVDNNTEQNSVTLLLDQYGVNMERVVFQQIALNSVWIRDYGPWWIYEPGGRRAIIDLDYNRPRPLDDAFPENLANLWGTPYYGAPLIEAGGNLLLDGQGAALVSDIIFDPGQGFDPNLTQALLEQYLLDYFGVHKVIVTQHLQYDGTGHIDMFVKLLNDTTVLVGEYESPAAGAGNNYSICNQVAAHLAAETNGAGRPFQVVRMLMPPYSGGNTYTYINSLIVNKKVFVPVYGFTTDDSVLTQYAQLLPGYEVTGFDCNQIIPANGAIHCITMKVPARLPWVDPCAGWVTGDLNRDGAINIFDLLLVVDAVLETGDLGICPARVADVNADGNVTIFDVIALVDWILQ